MVVDERRQFLDRHPAWGVPARSLRLAASTGRRPHDRPSDDRDLTLAATPIGIGPHATGDAPHDLATERTSGEQGRERVGVRLALAKRASRQGPTIARWLDPEAQPLRDHAERNRNHDNNSHWVDLTTIWPSRQNGREPAAARVVITRSTLDNRTRMAESPRMRVLCTGFEPFNGSHRNPSQALVEGLLSIRDGAEEDTGVASVREHTGVATIHDGIRQADALLSGIDLDVLILPVTTGVAAAKLIDRFEACRPHAVVLFGESAAASAITLERVAINLRDFRIPDESGTVVRDAPVVAGGPAAYFATLPIRELESTLRGIGVPVDVSYSAGTYLCNEVSYALLHHAATHGAAAAIGFVHLPRLPEQVVDEHPPRPSMSLETTLRAARALIASLSRHV
jgi:pyroglutamyl-peptidase